MAPKYKPTTSSGAQPKKRRPVLTLQVKLVVLGLLRDSMLVSNVAQKYGRIIIYIHITRYIQKHVFYGRFKGFSRVILIIRDFEFTRRL
jgi:hypothetical protein